MQRTSTIIVLLSIGIPAFADEKPKANVRTVIESYVAAALAGKVEDASALAVQSQSPARKKNIEEFKALLDVKALKIISVHVSDKKGEAIAVSESVKLVNVKPARDTGCMVFKLIRVKEKWLLKDIDFRPEEAAKEKVKEFDKKYPDAQVIPGK